MTGAAATAYTNLSSEEAVVQEVLAELNQIFDGQASTSFTGEYLLLDWESSLHGVLGRRFSN